MHVQVCLELRIIISGQRVYRDLYTCMHMQGIKLIFWYLFYAIKF